MIVHSTITWPTGQTTTRSVDMDNQGEKRRFACVARAALEKGATVTTKREDRPSRPVLAPVSGSQEATARDFSDNQ